MFSHYILYQVDIFCRVLGFHVIQLKFFLKKTEILIIFMQEAHQKRLYKLNHLRNQIRTLIINHFNIFFV